MNIVYPNMNIISNAANILTSYNKQCHDVCVCKIMCVTVSHDLCHSVIESYDVSTDHVCHSVT